MATGTIAVTTSTATIEKATISNLALDTASVALDTMSFAIDSAPEADWPEKAMYMVIVAAIITGGVIAKRFLPKKFHGHVDHIESESIKGVSKQRQEIASGKNAKATRGFGEHGHLKGSANSKPKSKDKPGGGAVAKLVTIFALAVALSSCKTATSMVPGAGIFEDVSSVFATTDSIYVRGDMHRHQFAIPDSLLVESIIGKSLFAETKEGAWWLYFLGSSILVLFETNDVAYPLVERYVAP